MKIMVAVLMVMASLSTFCHADVVGQWATEESLSIVELVRGEDGLISGTIVSLKEPLTPEGQPKTDKENPDPELQQRPILGLKILWDFEPGKKNEWKRGRIYDPKSGKTYHCKMTLEGNVLKVRGSLDKWGLAGRSTIWTRVVAE